MISLKKQVANLMNEGLGTKEIYQRLKPMNPTTTYGSIAFNVCVIKKRDAKKATNEQTQAGSN